MGVYKSEAGKQQIHRVYNNILDDWPVENSRYKVNTNYGETFIIESGSKDNPPLVLIHGSVANSYCWIGDVKEYSKYFNVYAIDIIGEAGFSDENRPKYESGDYPEWLREVFDQLSLEVTSIVGLSLGGWMALSFATKYPERVENLILLCPGGLYPEKKSFLLKAIGYSLLGKWGNKQITKMINGGKLPDYNDEGLRRALDYTTLIHKNFNPRMDKLPIFSGRDLKKLTMSVLAIYGENDCIMDVENSINHLKAYTQNADTIVLMDTGHVVTNQTERIVNFIRKL